MTRIRRPATYDDLVQRLELARLERDARRARWRARLARLCGATPEETSGKREKSMTGIMTPRPITPLEETR